jgi:plasmid stabilization system protein ParE
MIKLLQAGQILRRAEAEVQKLLVSSARSGEYEAVTQLADLAGQLRRLAEQVEMGNGRGARTADGEANNVVVSSTAAMPATRSASRDARPAGCGTRRGRVKPKCDYPQFYRDRDELVKIGWSKKKKAEYRHKAPWQVVQAVVKAIEATGAIGDKFDFEPLLPIPMESGSEVPSYQAYLVLAWLRHENLITQHGRQGYSLAPIVGLLDAVEERWRLLPKFVTRNRHEEQP